MKSLYLILFLCSSCRYLDQKIIMDSAIPDINPAHAESKQAFVYSAQEQPFSTIAQTVPIKVPFIYPVPLTNCWIESSQDLTEWKYTEEYGVITNPDQSWTMVVTNSEEHLFYRVVGEPL